MQIDPMTGEPIDPLTGAPLQQPMQQQMPALSQGPMHDFANSPGWAMANQAVNNMSAMRRGRAPQTSPAQAYQQAVGFNANLRMRREQQKQIEEQRQHQRMISTNADQRAQSREERDANPMYEFDAFVERMGLQEAPYEDQLSAWREFSSTANSGRIQRSFIGENGNMWVIDGTGNPRDTGVAGSPGGAKLREVGGVTYVDIEEPGGRTTTMPLAEYEQLRRQGVMSDEAEAEASGKKLGEYKIDNLSGASEAMSASQNAYDMAENMSDISQRFLTELENGNLDTGPLNKMIYDFFGVAEGNAAELDAARVEQTLRNLQVVNLAPVTIGELKLLANLWADLGKQEGPNKALLRRAIKKAEKIKGLLKIDAARQVKSIKEYGGDEELIRHQDLYGETFKEAFPSAQPPSGGSFNMGGSNYGQPQGGGQPIVEWGQDANGNPVRLN